MTKEVEDTEEVSKEGSGVYRDDPEYVAAFLGEEAPTATESEATAKEEAPVKDPDLDDSKESSEKGSKSVQDDTKGEPKNPFAWIDALPEGVRKQAESLKGQFDSDRGRVAALQRQLDSRTLADQAKAVAEAEGRTTTPVTRPPLETEELPQHLQDFIEKYPQLAESIKTMNERSADALVRTMQEQIEESLRPIREDRALEKLTTRNKRMAEGAAIIFDTSNTGLDYKEVSKSEFYKQWLSSQPTDFQNLARTTQDPDTALLVLEKFANDAEQLAIEQGIVDPATSGEEDEPSGASSEEADATIARRKQVKSQSGTPTTRGTPSTGEDNTTYEDEFRRGALEDDAQRAKNRR